mgnify:CR=1 FL=1
MNNKISKLIIGISSRALFNLDESHEIYEKQIKAVKQIRDDMKELNNEVIDSLKKVNLHSVGFPPSIWAMNTGKDFIGNIDIFEKEIGEIIPICFGDVVQRDDENEFGIL